MKKIIKNPWLLLAVISMVFFLVFWSVWFYGYKFYLIWLEGHTYFSTLPDFKQLYSTIPQGLPAYIGAFLRQFYSMPLLGAAIQSIFSIWPALCVGIVAIRLLKEPQRYLWIASLALPVLIYRQFWDIYMVQTVRYFIFFTVLMIVVVSITAIKSVNWKLFNWMGNKYLGIAVSSVFVCISVYMLLFLDPRTSEHEERARLEYLAENHMWEDILKEVSPKESCRDSFKRRYALLALSQTGLLTEHAFRYGLSDSDDFIFRDAIEPLAVNFNAILYQCLGMHNASIHQAYQLGVQSVPGIGFSALRRLADIYLELKDYDLAKKYIHILSHSHCHKKWIQSRLIKLDAIRFSEAEYTSPLDKATISGFTSVITPSLESNLDNKRYTDLLLCSLLADEEGDKFKHLLRYIAPYQYQEGKGLPRLYEEALVLISMTDPSVLDGYVISNDTQTRFADYVGMMNAGRGTQALRKHADTYWAYSY